MIIIEIIGVSLLIILSMEIYYFVNSKARMASSWKFGVIAGVFWALIVIIYINMTSSHGEEGLAAIVASPGILLGFVSLGILIGYAYKPKSILFRTWLDRKRSDNIDKTSG